MIALSSSLDSQHWLLVLLDELISSPMDELVSSLDELISSLDIELDDVSNSELVSTAF